MKKIVLVLSLVVASVSVNGQSAVVSPCNDSLYTVLKSRPIAYFNQKEKDCAEYRKALMQEEVKVESLNVAKKTMNTYWTVAIIGVALSLVPLLLL
jgi:ABC-type microcin C transport system permease subunit YejE